jgi:hypothetical protein
MPPLEKKKVVTNILTLEKLQERLEAIEQSFLHTIKEVIPGKTILPTSVDISIFEADWAKHVILQKLYPPQEDGSRIYKLEDYELSPSTSGYWPNARNWKGLYLGGCEQGNEMRRAVTIPLCLKNTMDFFTPQGLSTSVIDSEARIEALNTCSAAIIDFTGDEQCLNFAGAMDCLYLFAHGFVNVSIINLDASPFQDAIRFDSEQLYPNVFGNWDSTSLRQRRFEYYSILRLVVSKMEDWSEYQTVSGVKGLGQNMTNLRANYKRPHGEGIMLSVLDRLAVYRLIASMTFITDIGAILRICIGMLLLCEMRELEFMTNNMPEWKQLRGEFAILCMKVEKDQADLLLVEVPDDAFFNKQACVDFVLFVMTVVSKCRFLN